MFAEPLKDLPQANIQKILVLRTAPTPQVRWTIEQLRHAYPQARFSVLGTQLDNSLFDGMDRMSLGEPWLTPRSYKPLSRRVAAADFDLAVMCLNGEPFMAYEKVSQVMKRVPARIKLVAAYSQEWYAWKRELFPDGSLLVRCVLNAFETVLLPSLFLVVAAMPSRNTYMPEGQGRQAPGYDR